MPSGGGVAEVPLTSRTSAAKLQAASCKLQGRLQRGALSLQLDRRLRRRRGPRPASRYRRGGQAVIEYAILLATVTAAFLVMQVYAKRGIQGAIKTGADALSPFRANEDAGFDTTGELAQADGMRFESGDSTFHLSPLGLVLANESSSATEPVATVMSRIELPGGVVIRNMRVGSTSTGSSRARVVTDDNP